MAFSYQLPALGQAIVYDLLGACAGVAVLVGIRLYRPARPTPWLFLAAAQFVWVAGDIAWDVLALGFDADPFPSGADLLYLAGFPLAAVGLVLLVARRGRTFDWHTLVDPAIVTVTLGVVGWVVLVGPVAADPTLTPLERVVALAYPLGDVLLLMLLVPLLATAGRRSTAVRLLAASLAAAIVGDALFAIATPGSAAGGITDSIYLVGYALWGAAALHPSMAVTLTDEPVVSSRLTPIRLAGFMVALSVPAVILTAELELGVSVDGAALAIGFGLIAILVFVRLAGLVGELSRGEELYRTLVERSADAIFLVAGDPPAIQEANAAACELLGRDRAELVGMPIGAIVPPDERPRQRERIAAMRGSGEPVRVGLRMLRADGAEVEVELSQQATHDGRIVGVARDVGERKRAEAERARLAAAVEQTADTVVITDLDGRIVYVNPAFERLTGHALAELVGQPPDATTGVFGTRTDTPELWAALGESRPWAGIVANRRADGTTLEVDVVISQVRDESGAPIGSVGVGRDVTERRVLEAQLRQAQKMEAVGQFAGGMAHDFNNLLTAIRGYAALVLDRLPADDERIRPDVDQVVLAADRATVLTRQMLAFSRRQALHPRVVGPAEVVVGIMPMLRPILGEQVELVVLGKPGLGSVRVDPGGLEQVIVNLVMNAGDAMPTGGVVTIDTAFVELDDGFILRHPEVEPGPYLRISVSDTGVGMDAATAARAFEPFFTTKEPGKGTGMGLAMVYGFVKQSGGYVYIESTLGRGTSVRIYFPRVAAEPWVTAGFSPASPVASGSETILLAEDEAAVRSLARRMLESCGYRVLEAGCGAEALALAAGDPAPIDLLVTDVVMPGMGGRELAELLTVDRPGVHVLYMSGYTERVLGGSGLPKGEVAFLAKPFSGEALGAAVRAALERPA